MMVSISSHYVEFNIWIVNHSISPWSKYLINIQIGQHPEDIYFYSQNGSYNLCNWRRNWKLTVRSFHKNVRQSKAWIFQFSCFNEMLINLQKVYACIIKTTLTINDFDYQYVYFFCFSRKINVLCGKIFEFMFAGQLEFGP